MSPTAAEVLSGHQWRAADRHNVTASTSQSEDQTPATIIMEWTTVAFMVEDQHHITSHTNITSVWHCNRNPDSSGSSNHSSSSSSSAHRRPILWLPTCHTPLITDVTRWLHHSKRNYLHLESKFAAWSLTENLHVINNKRTYHPWPQQDFKLQFVTASYTHSSHLSTSENWHGTQNHQGCHVIPQNEVLQQEAWEFHHHTNKKYVMLTRKDNGPENGMKCT